MRYLGLDLGTKTLGVSISDITKTVASTYTTIRYSESDYQFAINKVIDIVAKESISKIILGFPKNMNNSIGERAQITLMFKEALAKRLNIEIIMQDERLSSVQANNYMLEADISRKKRKTKIDSLAANIILQTYLDKERNERDGRTKI